MMLIKTEVKAIYAREYEKTPYLFSITYKFSN